MSKPSFEDGIWYAVDILVEGYDQPSMAREIIEASGIKQKEALKLNLAKENSKTYNILVEEGTWNTLRGGRKLD